MTLDLDPSNDFLRVTDGLAAVTVTRPGRSGSTAVTHALRQQLRTREAEASAGRYTASDVAWHLPVSELAEAPRPGDVICDAEGEHWTVLDAQKTALASRWRCVARNLAVCHALDQYVDVEKAVYAKGDGGAEEPAWHTWRTGLRAKIQPAAVEVASQHGRTAAAARYKVFLTEDLALDHSHRIRAPDGTLYRVLACGKAGRIDALLEVDVQLDS